MGADGRDIRHGTKVGKTQKLTGQQKMNKKEHISLSTWSFSDLVGEAWRESRYSSSTGPTAGEGFLSLWASSSFSWLFPLLYTLFIFMTFHLSVVDINS